MQELYILVISFNELNSMWTFFSWDFDLPHLMVNRTNQNTDYWSAQYEFPLVNICLVNKGLHPWHNLFNSSLPTLQPENKTVMDLFKRKLPLRPEA